MSVKINQPLTLQLTITSTADLTGTSSSYMEYLSPCGSTGLWSTTTFNSSTVITYELSSGVLTEAGIWKITSYLKNASSFVYPTTTYDLTVLDTFD